VNFTKEPVFIQNAGAFVKVTQKGIQQFILANVARSAEFIQQISIPDFSVKAAGFQISFADVRISNMQFPGTNLVYNENFASFEVQSLNFTMVFQFRVQQLSYPYVSDSGDGLLLLNDIQLTFQMRSEENRSCRYHL